MIPARLLQHQVTIVYRAPGADGRYGQGDLVETSRVTVPAWMQMENQAEVPIGETTLVTWKLIVNPSYIDDGGNPTTIDPPTPTSLIEWGARTFRCEGGAMEYRTPREAIHHYEAQLVEVIE